MATAKKAPAKKTAAKKTTTRKTAASKSQEFSLRDSAERMVNIYLGVIGTGVDSIQENIESARKDSEKRIKSFEKRGVSLRNQLTKRIDEIEMPDVVEDAREQFSKVQEQVEEAVESVKDKLSSARAA